MHWRHLSRLATSEVRIGYRVAVAGWTLRLRAWCSALAAAVFLRRPRGYRFVIVSTRASTEAKIGRNERALHRDHGAAVERAHRDPGVASRQGPSAERGRRLKNLLA